ncbi:hypothetical protein [Cellulosimicrobium sp. SL-1]|uniref:DUF7426 family protein n=1 Tax=Cellulosimicrobium sp. SL-1 TaxID=2699423 RepID=UPI0013D0C0C1|nr:hypothetical protein [Cellulosimicrobium sp. SL-1]
MTVDFSEWAVPSLPLTLGERTYTVRPPSVGDMGKLLACAVRAEVNLGIAKGPIPTDVQAVLDTIGPGDHPALGADVYQQMVDDGVHPTTIDRMAYYAVFYWTRGKAVADIYATALWTPRDGANAAQTDEDDLPKAPPTSRRNSGRGSGSANPSTTTSKGSRSSRTTGSRRT